MACISNRQNQCEVFESTSALECWNAHACRVNNPSTASHLHSLNLPPLAMPAHDPREVSDSIIPGRTLALGKLFLGLVKDYEYRAWVTEHLGTVEAQAFLLVDRGDE